MPLTPEAKVIYVHLAGFLARSYQTPSHSRYDIEEQWHAGLFDFLRNGPYSSGELLRLSTGFPFKHRQEAGVSPKTVQNYKKILFLMPVSFTKYSSCDTSSTLPV